MERDNRSTARSGVAPARCAALRYALNGAFAGVVPAAWGQAPAQAAWPNRPIRVVIPVPAGSAFDTVIRPLGQRLPPLLGQPFVIDKKPGVFLRENGHKWLEWVQRIDPKKLRSA
jgi:hypothetical protein